MLLRLQEQIYSLIKHKLSEANLHLHPCTHEQGNCMDFDAGIMSTSQRYAPRLSGEWEYEIVKSRKSRWGKPGTIRMNEEDVCPMAVCWRLSPWRWGWRSEPRTARLAQYCMSQWHAWEQRIIDRARSVMRLREERGADKQVAARTFDTLIKE